MDSFAVRTMPGGVRRDSSRILGLDFLRALAISGVTLFHLLPDQLPGGYMGVSLFFVLTGFLLAVTSVRDYRAGRFGVLRYYARRVRRIYPSLIIVMLTTIGVYHFLAPEAIAAIRPEAVSVLAGYNNLWQIEQSADYFARITSASPFTHLWFMGIELQYYLVWPALFFLYLLFRATIGRGFALAVLAVAAAGAAAVMPALYDPAVDVTRLYYGTDTRVYALLMGAVLGLALTDREERGAGVNLGSDGTGARIAKCAVFVLVLAATIASYLLLAGDNPLVYQGGMLALTVGFTALIYVIASSPALGELLDCAPVRFIGRHSYGIFLWQYPVIFLAGKMGYDALPYGPLLEVAVIVLLALWSDALAAIITRPRALSMRRLAPALALVIITLMGTVFMGYGCYGLAMSRTESEVAEDLRAKLAQRAAEQRAANERAALEAEKARAAAEAERLASVDLSGIVCIGDSVMLGASGEIRAVLPGAIIDAEVSRYVGGAQEVAEALNAQGQLGDTVVIALGTNGPIAGAERYEGETRALIDYLGPSRHIFWVNSYCPKLKWQQTNNDYLNNIVKTHPNITIIDWYSVVNGHSDYLVADGIHPSEKGAKEYARVIHDTIQKTLAASDR